ncbi:uncharacterized protein LOC112685081 isoform X2 [Sipha flava]|uniref:Uncharacterized protein LOC112685081 isoform X2 n=1 Tax=Sipha flava TaxID=143950 RepID=A0A8B8FQ77_9HEMI|nr:uncharacterized protein LOC112685081 isoform X2 [Sipha flava]
MDTLSEIKRKMDTGNTILVAAATDSLVNIIKCKIKGTRTDMTNIPEMLLLQEYCCHQNPIICTTNFKALCTFMISNNYQNQLLIDWLVLLRPQTKCKTGFIQEIFELIVFLLNNDENINNECTNTLIDLIIKIMDEDLDDWRIVLFHMQISTNFDNHKFITNWLKVTKRLFKFIFLSPTSSNYRASFVKLFIEIICFVSDYDSLFEVHSWLQVDNLDDTIIQYNILEEFCDKIPDTLHEIKYNLCLCLVQTATQLISYGFDPTHMLLRLNSLLKTCPCASDISLLCISSSLSQSPSKFVLKMMNFCLKVIKNFGCHKIVAQTVIASILQWNRAKVIDCDTMNLFLSTVNSDLTVSRSCTQNHKLSLYLTTDSSLIIPYLLIKLSSEFYSKQFFSKWLSEINSSSELINDTTFGFYLAGLYLSKIGDHSQQQAILKLLNKKILLPLIAYAVDLETSHYNRFDLIKAIPTTACTQENISLIISLIKRFENSNEEVLNILSIDMFYDLWITEVRCYRFLLYCLSKDKSGLQWNIVKAYTIKKLVESNPNSDLVAVLKQMLELYIKQSMYLPMKLALESLVDLCITKYMNPEALLKIIDKNIVNIHHPSVISSYCNLLAVCANQSTDSRKRIEFFQNLWSMVVHPNDNTVKCALKSLCLLDLECIPLNVLPEKFQSFPKIVTQLEDLEKIELFNGPIPGECWVKFLQSINKMYMNEAQLMLSVWLRRELEKNVITRVQSDHEPKNLRHLSNHSIARGLISFIAPKRKKMSEADEDTKVTCLAIINGADKPMYPLDWSFLEKYLREGSESKLWKESVVLIAKQATRSTSAFRLLYLCYKHYSHLDEVHIKLLLTTLYKVSNIIYHDLQKQFVTDIVNEVLNNIVNESNLSNNKGVDLLCHILLECKHILLSPETHLTNVNFICDILENIWCTIYLNNKKILYAFLDCCLVMPTDVLNNLRPYPIQESMLSKFIILCCAQNFIFSNVSFDGLIKCIQACNQFAKENDYLYAIIIDVFKLEVLVPYHHDFIEFIWCLMLNFCKSHFNIIRL